MLYVCVQCMYTCIQILTQTRNYIVPVLRGAVRLEDDVAREDK
jgi:hypothetical protein